MKKTALYDSHLELNAKLIDFAGFMMPVQYEGVNIEHKNVKDNVGVFDVSHMGEFYVHGDEAEIFLQSVLSNDISKIKKGQAQYNCIPNENGGIVDDLILYKFEDNRYMMVVNASNIEKDWNWISSLNDLDVEMTNVSDEYTLLAIQGPQAATSMQSLTDVNLSEMPYYTFQYATFAGIQDVMISATGYTGSGGFEIYVKNEDAEKLWDSVFEAGKAFGIKPIGLAARDTLRLEMGFCLYGNDINDETSPLEAGLGWITKFTKKFVDSEYLSKQKEEGIQRKLIPFELIDRGIPRQGYEIADSSGRIIGHVTSGTMSPSMKIGIGLGYVQKEYSTIDSEIYIMVRNKSLKAKVVKLPFYKK